MNSYVMIYPGSRVYLSQFIVRYVWKEECYRIFEYINEEDPLKLKYTTYSIKNTLDCVGRYRKREKRPFLYPKELERYNTIMKARSKNSICGHPIHKTILTTVESEYLEDCKLV
jgi:hypothetical protein